MAIRAVWARSAVLRSPYRPLRAMVGADNFSLALLLDADYGAVGFSGRQVQLDALSAWATSPAPVSVCLVTGAGGSGKTRLGAEVVDQFAAQGWVTGFLTSGNESGALDQLALLSHRRLIVIDDADRNTAIVDQMAGLLEQLGTQPDPIRVLILARHAGNWWTTRRVNSQWLTTAQTEAVDALLTVDRPLIYQSALSAYSSALDLPTPSGPSPRLDSPTHDQPLFILIEALRSVSEGILEQGSAQPDDTPVTHSAEEVATNPRAALLDWVLYAEWGRVGNQPPVFQRAIAHWRSEWSQSLRWPQPITKRKPVIAWP